MRSRITVGIWLVILISGSAFAQTTPTSSLQAIQANDNRTPAGQLKNGVLELRLELRQGSWYPESDSGGHREVYAFAEEGRAPQIPAPLIRVPQGTRIHIVLRNMLPLAAKLYGLHQHPGGSKDTVSVAPGEIRTLQFLAGEPGTYIYKAATSVHPREFSDSKEKLLSGAFIVDAPGAATDDQIFVIGIWSNFSAGADEEIAALNGKSWPFTERLTLKQGETYHWRVINPSQIDHAMHLHGFYFHVDGVGDGERFERYPEDQRRLAVTEHVDIDHVFEMTWTPDRPGNWLFHCHMLIHMSPTESLHPKTVEPAEYSPDHDQAAGMGGLVIGITVVPSANETAARIESAAIHKLQLIIADNPAKLPLYTVEVIDPKLPAAPTPDKDKPISLLGPPVFLTRGETTEIEIENQTAGPTAIHWHGMELESYYDGVAGWTGLGQQTTPAIAPGASFTARMTPPRAGTFIYHTHWHDDRQLFNGVYGPLIVLDPGQKYDPETDRILVFSFGRYAPFGLMLLVNGHPQPDPLELHTGIRYRLRMINITSSAADLRVRLTSSDAVAQWKVIAKDGADVPSAQLRSSDADMGITVGETYDIEYQTESPGVADLKIWELGYPSAAILPLQFVAPK
jgi:FtsP/CotA-like multicopper oxidase with cupredoxin domain